MNINFIINHIHPNLIPDFDLLNPPRGTVPGSFGDGEVHPDAMELIQRLSQAHSEGAVRQIIFEYFGKYFGSDICGSEWDEVKDSVLDLWKWYGREAY